MSSSEKAEFAKVNFQKTVLLGNKNLQEKSYDWAQRYYTQALEMARRLMDNQAEANLYQLLIRAAYLGQDWEKAAALQQERLNSAAAGIAPAPGWENLSYFNLQLNRWRETLQCADNAAEIYISTAEYRKAAQAYQTIALGLESKNNYASAILCAEKSRDIVRRYNLSDTEQIEILLAKLNFEAGKISQAEDILTALFREGAISPGRRFFANLLMARSKFAALDYSAAMEYFLQALNLADKDSLLQRSQAFQGLADVNYRLNDYTAALAFIDTARACCENIPSGTAYLSFNTEALTLWKMGRLKAAGDAFQRALDSVIKSTDRKSEASIRRNYSAFLCKADDHQKALFQINLALENSRTVKDSVQQACDLLIIAGIQLQTGEAAKAKAALDQFSALMGKESPPLLKIKYLFLQSYYEYSQGQYRRAGEMLAPVLEDKVSWQLPEMNWRICLLMGMINDKLKKSAEAVNYYEQSMTSLQKLTCPRWDGEIITVVMDDVWTAFEKAAETALLNGDFSACRDIMEKRNALREKFAVAERGLKLRTRQAYSYEEANLRSNIESLQRQLESAAETEADTLDAVLKSVRLKHSELLNTIQNWDPGYYRAVSGSPLFTQNKEYENKLAQFLLSCNAGIIEYSVFPSNIYACLTTSDTLIGRKIDLSRQNLRFYGNIMRQSIEGRLNIELQAKMFYEKLLQPFEAELSGKENLIIIPDDALWQLPFDALMDDKGIWAIDKWSISLEFSLDAIISGLEKHASGSEDIVLYAAAEAPGMQKLEFAEREVESIAFTLPQAEVYFTGSISGEELKKRCQQSAITHLACHGKDVSGAPIDYCLMLTQKGAAGLSARELYGWETDAELFFLSACGKGIFSDTDYFELSLPQALMFAGAGAVISSLWKVDDLAAAALAKRCYRLIAEGKSKADALRTAKLFLKDRINPHPSFWAAFQLYGNRAGWSKFNKGDYNLHYSGITK